MLITTHLSTIKCLTAQATNSINTYSTRMLWVLLQVVYSFVRAHRRHSHKRITVTSVPARLPECSRSQCLRSMLMMFSVIMVQRLDSSMMPLSSIWSNVVSIEKKLNSSLSLPLSMKSSTRWNSNHCVTVSTIW